MFMFRIIWGLKYFFKGKLHLRVSGEKKKNFTDLYFKANILALCTPRFASSFLLFHFLTKSPNFLLWVTLSLCLAVSLFTFKAVLSSSLEPAHQKNSLVSLSINQRETSRLKISWDPFLVVSPTKVFDVFEGASHLISCYTEASSAFPGFLLIKALCGTRLFSFHPFLYFSQRGWRFAFLTSSLHPKSLPI